MKLLVVHDAITRGGAESYTLGVVRELVRRGDEIICWTNHQGFAAELAGAGAAVETMPVYGDFLRSRGSFLRFMARAPIRRYRFRRRLRLVRRQRVQAVYLSILPDKFLLTDVAVKLDLPVFWVEYAPLGSLLPLYKGLVGKLYRRQAGYVKKIFSISQYSINSLVAEGVLKPEQFTLTYAGATGPTPTEQTQAEAAGKALRQHLALRGPVIANISRLAPEKGQEVLIRAFAEVQKKYPAAALLLSGDGPERADLEKMTGELELRDHVHFLGFYDDKWRLLAATDVFVFPSYWRMEGFGIVSVEAMLMGKPVVASNHGPIPEIVVDGTTGRLVPPQDAPALAVTLNELLADPAWAKQMGQAGRRRAEELFSAARVADITHQTIVETLTEAT